MIVTYSLTVTAVCPVSRTTDLYELIVHSRRTIMVEDILAAVVELTGLPVTQEALTESLHHRLGAEVHTHGEHSGVRTRVIFGGDYEATRFGRDAGTPPLPRT